MPTLDGLKRVRLPAKLDDACYRYTINLWRSNITPFQSKIDWVNPY